MMPTQRQRVSMADDSQRIYGDDYEPGVDNEVVWEMLA